MAARNVIAIGFTAIAFLTACMTAPELPTTAKPVVTCIYDVLKLTPGITAVDVYVLDKGGVVVEYAYRGGDERPALTDLYISGPNAAGRFQYVGDFMDSRINPVSHMSEELASKCQADGYYNDQVFITSPQQRVEMRRHVTLPN